MTQNAQADLAAIWMPLGNSSKSKRLKVFGYLEEIGMASIWIRFGVPNPREVGLRPSGISPRLRRGRNAPRGRASHDVAVARGGKMKASTLRKTAARAVSGFRTHCTKCERHRP